MRSRRPFILVLLPLLVAAMVIGGCRRDFTTEADALRERVMLLEREVAQLERENAELRAELRQMARREQRVDEDVLTATPRVTSINIGRLSHARDTLGDGVPDILRLYINPLDGRGRFVALTGPLRVHAAILPERTEAITLGRIELDPEAVRDRYRSGITGTHYTIELPIDWPGDVDAEAFITADKRLMVSVLYEDGWTGEQFATEQAVRIRGPRGRSRGATQND
jgi:hypothetical protein